MLKYLFLALFFVGLYPINSLAASGKKIVNFCELVDNDDLKELKRQIKKASLPKKSLSTAIDCSANQRFAGGNLLRLAISSGSYEVGNFLIKSTYKAQLKAPDLDGLTILQWSTLYYEDNAASEAIISQLKMKLND